MPMMQARVMLMTQMVVKEYLAFQYRCLGAMAA